MTNSHGKQNLFPFKNIVKNPDVYAGFHHPGHSSIKTLTDGIIIHHPCLMMVIQITILLFKHSIGSNSYSNLIYVDDLNASIISLINSILSLILFKPFKTPKQEL